MAEVASSSSKGKEKALEIHQNEHEAAASSSSTSSSSDSDSESSTASDSDFDSDSDSDDISQEYLDSLLLKAKENMKERSQGKKQAAFGDEEIRLDEGKERPLGPLSLDPGTLPSTYFDFDTTAKGEAPRVRDQEVERLAQSSSSRAIPDAPAPPELARDGRKLTKKEKKEGKKKAAGPGWFDLPTPDAADLPRLYREVEALRLRNTLDPKRFYRKEEGEGKGIKGLPKHFAIGTIVPTSTPFGTTSSANLTKAERKRTIIDELVDDSEAKRYAKKKFTDLQSVRGAKGRRTLAIKNAARKPKW